jgi:hypothetical protein
MKNNSDADHYRSLLLGLIASLTYAGNMGDVWNSVDFVLKEMGFDWNWDGCSELANLLRREGIKTLHGTEVSGDEVGFVEDECDERL